MRNFIIGMLCGILMLFSVAAYAEDGETTLKNIIGSIVAGSFPVTVNGTQIAEPAAVIKIGEEDKGYLPIRAIGEALGAEITFDADLGIMINSVTESVYEARYVELLEEKNKLEADKLKQHEETSRIKLEKLNEERIQQKLISIGYKINGKKEILESAKKRLSGLKNEIHTYSDAESKAIVQDRIEETEAEITKLEAELADLEKQKAELEANQP